MKIAVFAVLLIIIFVIGFFFGRLFANRCKTTNGTVHVDYSDPEGPYIFLELEESVDDLVESKYLMATVQPEKYATQK